MTDAFDTPKYLAPCLITAIWLIYAGIIVAYHHYWEYANHTMAWISISVMALLLVFSSVLIARKCHEARNR